VYALKTNSGKLIYKLRIAPEEKRMLSYGKVESVWPAIGGVMIVDGKAFATAGRTQGSDGGLVVRSFEPETGKHLWSKALPQFSKEFTEKKPKRNDILVRHGDHLTIMGHWLNLANGRISPKPKADPQDRAVTVGLEGFHSWNWTRLGHRKFMHIGFGEFKGDTVSWSDKYVATTNRNGGVVSSTTDPKKRSGLATVPRNYQTTSLVIANNLIIQGGAILDHETDRGFIRAVGFEDRKLVWEKTFPSKLAFNGLSADSCGIIATFNDGTVVCLK
jgi:hypothetical protein